MQRQEGGHPPGITWRRPNITRRGDPQPAAQLSIILGTDGVVIIRQQAPGLLRQTPPGLGGGQPAGGPFPPAAPPSVLPDQRGSD